jgi:rRNA maturation endonuclease Nob1
MLSISKTPTTSTQQGGEKSRSWALRCADCDRAFTLPMHLGRHRKTKHGETAAE